MQMTDLKEEFIFDGKARNLGALTVKNYAKQIDASVFVSFFFMV